MIGKCLHCGQSIERHPLPQPFPHNFLDEAESEFFFRLVALLACLVISTFVAFIWTIGGDVPLYKKLIVFTVTTTGEFYVLAVAALYDARLKDRDRVQIPESDFSPAEFEECVSEFERELIGRGVSPAEALRQLRTRS